MIYWILFVILRNSYVNMFCPNFNIDKPERLIINFVFLTTVTDVFNTTGKLMIYGIWCTPSMSAIRTTEVPSRLAFYSAHRVLHNTDDIQLMVFSNAFYRKRAILYLIRISLKFIRGGQTDNNALFKRGMVRRRITKKKSLPYASCPRPMTPCGVLGHNQLIYWDGDKMAAIFPTPF